MPLQFTNSIMKIGLKLCFILFLAALIGIQEAHGQDDRRSRFEVTRSSDEMFTHPGNVATDNDGKITESGLFRPIITAPLRNNTCPDGMFLAHGRCRRRFSGRRKRTIYLR
ncbi:hypothetical protein C0J52_03256 [Blattella germanica]|nr:hypothetical protein C0J52_03256 [Blattella germanica]